MNLPPDPHAFDSPPEKRVIDLPTTDVNDGLRIPLARRVRNLYRQLQQQGLVITLIEAYDQTVRLVTGAPTLRYSRLLSGVFIGGQHLRRGLPILQARGITAVVNMRREYDDRAAGTALDRYLHLATIDNTPPTLEHLQQGVDFIAAEITRGGRVYIHCWEGVGRAPTMAAVYLVSTGLSPDNAWTAIRRARPFVRPTPFQMAQVAQYARRWDVGQLPPAAP